MGEPLDSGKWRGGAILPLGQARSGVGDASLHGSPEVTITLGRDRHSSGISVRARTPSGGQHPHVNLLMAERWNDPLPGVEGCVEIVITALQSVLGELRGMQREADPGGNA
jgi:hypothetical protein